jgi:shikimate kinase
VFLVGYMGSGKNTVGQELARRLGWRFVDLDALVEVREGQCVPEIFHAKGEAGFRQAESAALKDLLKNSLTQNCIVALGGGAFIQENNRALLRAWPTIFLDAPPEELWQRCQQDSIQRPLRRDPQQFSSLLAERLPFYRQASLTVETSNKELPSICLEIERALRLDASPDSLGTGELH